MKVLITGAGGQVGRELVRASWSPKTEILAFTRSELDICDQTAVDGIVEQLRPDAIVNAAAYTGVDAAEDDEASANLINSVAVGYLARAAEQAACPLVHISTDYVFDGTSADWYAEKDETNPLGAYGRTKLAGEQACLSIDLGVVLRTSWVYGALGSNFVTTMLRLAAERDALGVVDDQFGCPTAAKDIASTITQIVEERLIETTPHRIFHVASPDDASWHDVAMATFNASTSGFTGECKRLTTAEYPTPAPRPANSRLSTNLLTTELGIRLPEWRRSLADVVNELESL